MNSGGMSLTVLVHGHQGAPIEAREYVSPQDRSTYIEGREGSNFTLRISNGTGRRVLAIPSVDGMSTLNQKPAGSESPGFILEPFGSVDVEGWTLDDREAAKFYFAGSKDGADDSYVARIGGDVANKGAIGVLFVEERPLPARALGAGGGVFRGMAVGASSSALLSRSAAAASTDGESDGQTLGTGFGRAVSMPTRSGSFRRGRLLDPVVIYYDDARGLKRKGIDLSRPAAAVPNAFPGGIGCPTPPGWTR